MLCWRIFGHPTPERVANCSHLAREEQPALRREERPGYGSGNVIASLPHQRHPGIATAWLRFIAGTTIAPARRSNAPLRSTRGFRWLTRILQRLGTSSI